MLQDIRFAIRLLARDRSFAATALVTLALCIAANTTMFGIVRSVLLQPLPFPDSDRVVLLYNSYPDAGAPRAATSVPDYFDRLAAVPALDEQALFRPEGMTFGDENGAERLDSLRATPSFFRLLRIQPLHGRFFRDDEGERGRALKAILGHAFWQRKFAGKPDVVGRMIRMNGNQFEVVGVMPAAFTFLQKNIDVYVPAPFGPADRSDERRHTNNWSMVGHLKPGATLAHVRQQVAALNQRNDERLPEFRQLLKDAHFQTVVVFLHDDVVRDVKSVLYLLWGGVLFVLLIGGVNIANLVMVRSTARRREMAARQAIGGGVARVARQLLTETMLLSVAGGALGILGGWWTLRSVAALDLDTLPRGYEIGLDLPTVAVVLGLTCLVGLALGAAPIVSLRRMNLGVELQADGRGGTGSRRATLVRRVLATAQVAIAFVLLVGAGLLLASFRAVLRLDLGFEPARVMTATVSLPATAYRGEPSLAAFERRALDAIRALPTVEAAGVTSAVPFSGAMTGSVLLAEGYTMKPGESLVVPSMLVVSPGYFGAMRIPIVRGRDFDGRDGSEPRAAGPGAAADAPATSAIVDERLARRFWADQDPLGRRLYLPRDAQTLTAITPDTVFFTVVGVVKDVQTMDPRADAAPVGTYYLPYEQAPARGLTFVVKSRTAAAASALGAIRQQVAQIDPQLPVFHPRSMQEWIDRALVGRRVPMLIATAFGVVALVLSAVGIYGVLAYSVSERRRELGVRMALGGTTRQIFALVLKEGVAIISVGLGLGLTGSIGVGRLMRAELYGVAPADPRVLAGVTALLFALALIASVIPSWRASSIDPNVVLGK